MSKSKDAVRQKRLVGLLSGINDGDLDEVVHEILSSRASNINNEGKLAQVSFLIDEGLSDVDILAATQK